MWHVMVHCKHSRLAKALSDQSHSKRQRGNPPGEPLDVFFPPCCLLVPHRFKGQSRTAGRPCNEEEGSSCPLVLSVNEFSFSSRHSLSILNVSSVAGSASTMSGSLSMCSPSRVSGSIFSSSRGNWESASKLTSPTPARELVSSLDRLGGDSPVTEKYKRWEKRARLARIGLAFLLIQAKFEQVFLHVSPPQRSYFRTTTQADCKVPLKPQNKRSNHWKVYFDDSTPTLHRRTVYTAIDSYLVLFIRLDDRSV